MKVAKKSGINKPTGDFVATGLEPAGECGGDRLLVDLGRLCASDW